MAAADLWTVTVTHVAGTITPTTHEVAADNPDGARSIARHRVADARGISARDLVATAESAYDAAGRRRASPRGPAGPSGQLDP